MHLSYDYDIDSPNREGILDKIISEHGLNRDDGNIYIDINADLLYEYVFQFPDHSKVSVCNTLSGKLCSLFMNNYLNL